MEAIRRQEMAYSKLARARPNFYKDGDYDGNSYNESNHRGGNLTYRREIRIDNFSSHAKTFDHIPYDDYGGYHDRYDDGDQSCSRGVNHEELIDENVFGSGVELFLDGYVFLELNLACSTFYSRYISYSCYEIFGQRDHSLFVNMLYQVINLDRTYLLVVQDLFHAILVFIAHNIEPWNICGSLGNANHRTFGFLEKNSYGFDGFLFSLLGDHCVKFQGEVVEHLQYVFGENSWSMFLKFRFDGIFYHPPFKKFLKKMRFKEGGRGSWSFDHFVSISTHLNYQVSALVKYKVYPSCPNALEFLWKFIFDYNYLLGRDTFQTFSFLKLFLEFGNDESFYFYLPSKDVSECTFLEGV
ncbi:hypothetical protein M9H77_25779 [Catharanthus roseus]|uniref:Uncharacterized protein n=1 Tax=Catharanthus roseus TaxID=4058 RepID=A0ACC0ABV8_CATRO|nr:hypothetical protein M9H77_25779 [Catharanthus roseus]